MNQRILPHETLAASASPRRADAGLSALAALASFGAVLAAASCCVLPLALAALGVGAGLSSTFAARMPLRWPLTALSLVGLAAGRSEEHTSELQSLMRISYAVFCLKKKQ